MIFNKFEDERIESFFRLRAEYLECKEKKKQIQPSRVSELKEVDRLLSNMFVWYKPNYTKGGGET